MRRLLTALLAASLLAAGLVVASWSLRPAPAFAEEVYPRPADGVFSVEGHGWGHARGMGQYGAQGAAKIGKKAAEILSAYYPGTTQVTTPARKVRVWISGDDGHDVAVAPASGLAVRDQSTGSRAVLPGGVYRWRVVAESSVLKLQYRSTSTSAWTTKSVNGHTSFAGPLVLEGATQGYLKLYFADGSARDYRGSLTGVRTGTTTLRTVNTLTLEQYLYGVVPRESPSYFETEALRAQAIAARSYSLYKVVHVSSSSTYDICDTTACQVYGGMRLYSGSSTTQLEQASTTGAVDATRNLIRTYGGSDAAHVIFAEFSSSTGGWTTASSTHPYLSAHADPWDAIASPHHYWTAKLTAAQLEARYPSVGRLTRLRVLSRDGNGEWGGRVKQVVLEGVSSSGQATSVQASGAGIYLAHTWPASSTGLRGSWWRISNGNAATMSVRSADVKLIRPPGAATGKLAVNYTNTGTTTWPSTTRLVRADGSADPFVGGSRTPGTFDYNVDRAGATDVRPGERGQFDVNISAAEVAAGVYHPTYALRIGTGPVFGEPVTFTVTVSDAVFRGELAGPPAPTTTATGGAPPAVWSDGTVVLPRTGSVSVRVLVRNKGNLDWPVAGPVQLGTSEPRNRNSASVGDEWTAKTRGAVLSGCQGVTGAKACHPGDVGVFTLTLHGNGLAAGRTEESFEPVWNHIKWIDGAILRLHVVRVDPKVSRLAETKIAYPGRFTLFPVPGAQGSATFRVLLRNLGRDAWPVGGDDVLATASPADRPTVFNTPAWLSPTLSVRISSNASRASATSVYPGEVGVWNVPFSALHAAPGEYDEPMRPTRPNQRWGPVVTAHITVRAATFTGSLVRTSSPTLPVPADGEATAYVDIRNTGNVSWPAADVRLLVKGSDPSPSYAPSWLTTHRPVAARNLDVPGASTIAPGQVARFRFRLAGNGRPPGARSEMFTAVWEHYRHLPLTVTLRYTVV